VTLDLSISGIDFTKPGSGGAMLVEQMNKNGAVLSEL